MVGMMFFLGNGVFFVEGVVPNMSFGNFSHIWRFHIREKNSAAHSRHIWERITDTYRALNLCLLKNPFCFALNFLAVSLTLFQSYLFW